jgi:ribosomal protein S18 acetylase RimI-like enzyme
MTESPFDNGRGAKTGGGERPAPEPTIRRATRADMPAVGRLGALLVETHHSFDERRFLAATRGTKEGYASFLGSQLEEPDVAIFVAVDGPEVVGYAYVAIEGYDYMVLRGPAGLLHDLIVDPARRGGGIGRRLLAEAIAYVRSRGLSQIVLSTADRNGGAQRLFASAGFRRTMVEMTQEI